MVDRATIGIGLVLIAVGLSAYLGTSGTSVTALIPAALGLALCALGGVARCPRLRQRARYGAAAVALLGVLGSTRGLPGAVTLLAAGAVTRPAAVIACAITAALGAVLIGLYAVTLVTARRRPAAGVGTPGRVTPARLLRKVR